LYHYFVVLLCLIFVLITVDAERLHINKHTQTIQTTQDNNIETKSSSHTKRAQSCYQYDNSCNQCVSATIPGGCSFCASDGQCVPAQNATTYCGTGNVYFNTTSDCKVCTQYHDSCSACIGSLQAINENCVWCPHSKTCFVSSSYKDWNCSDSLSRSLSDCAEDEFNAADLWNNFLRYVIILTASLCCFIPGILFLCLLAARARDKYLKRKQQGYVPLVNRP